MFDLDRALRPLKTRVANILSRFVVQRVDDSPKMQLLQLGALADETREDVERFQNYGFTGVPLEGAEGVVLFVGGKREHGLAVAVDDRRYRIKNLNPGEVAVYTDQGDKIVIERGGTIRVTGATKVVVDAPLVELAGNTESAVKGTTYRSAEDTMLTALSTFVTAAGTLAAALVPGTGVAPGAQAPFAAAVVAFTASIASFQGAAATYLSTKVKLS